MKLLIVTAVDAERDAVLRGLRGSVHDVYTVGVGPTTAAAATARLLALGQLSAVRYDGVISAGIAGSLADRAAIGQTVIATASRSAELGVADDKGFTPIDELGYGHAVAPCAARLTSAVSGIRGEILTLATVTGTTRHAIELADAYPAAVAEAMEGFGVASAAWQVRLPFSEIRTISNVVGDRDTAGWDFTQAFAALTTAMEELR